MMAEQRVKGGRPRKHSPEAKRPTMAFRMGSQLHGRLIVSAAANERSLSEEIERILEAHFAAVDTRAIIREEIRAALAERPQQGLTSPFNGPPHHDAPTIELYRSSSSQSRV